MKINKNIFLLATLTLVASIFHFYNLNWGAPFYFHPDERNIASSVAQLRFPNQMNPNFFAYGSLPIYTIYFTGMPINIVNKISPQTVSFETAIVISRFYSALFATLLVPLMFFIGKKLKNETVGIISAFLTATSVGFVQFAHFGTFEMWLTFFTVLLFWLCLNLKNAGQKMLILLIAAITGILGAIKISHLILAPLILLFVIVTTLHDKKPTKILFRIIQLVATIIVFVATGLVIYCLTNPFVFLDPTAFRGSMNYESSLALGTLPVFYTGEFFNSIPVLFQFHSIYPFLLNPLITLLFSISFFFVCFKTIKTKNESVILLLAFYLLLFISQAILFAKWTRYMMPTLPFIYLIVALVLSDLKMRFFKPVSHLTLTTIFIGINILFAFSYFITAFVETDTRIMAYHFAQKKIPYDSTILSEVFDLGIVPFNDSFKKITLFNFYDLDNHSPVATLSALQTQLQQSNYIILPSQRIIKTRLIQKSHFPLANEFYTQLQNGSLGFTKIYQTPCDIFCNISYLGSPIFSFEETANVFDRPTLMIFKKEKK